MPAAHVSVDRQFADAVVIKIDGELDVTVTPVLSTVLADLHDGDSHRIVLDLTDVDIIDSAVLAVLVESRERCRLQGGSLAMTTEQPSVLRAVRLCRLEGLLNLRPTLSQAIAACG